MFASSSPFFPILLSPGGFSDLVDGATLVGIFFCVSLGSDNLLSGNPSLRGVGVIRGPSSAGWQAGREDPPVLHARLPAWAWEV